jgi:EAL domain-containing protein (putative c-di-GMP-specific phosphodiesterase class I)
MGWCWRCRAWPLLGSIVQMGHRLGPQVTAEGIERDEERAALLRLRADLEP